MDRRIIIVVLFALFLLPIVNSAPPFIQEQTSVDFDDGYILTTSQIYYLQVNEQHQFNFFVYNKTDGTLQDNSTINCTFYLANTSGDVLTFLRVPYFTSDGHWGIDILKGNFSYIGIYAYGLKCEGTTIGGAMTGLWETTYTGQELSTSQGILYGSLYLVLILFIIAILLIINMLPDENTKSDSGDIVSISLLKYLRGTLWMVEWMMLVLVMYLSSNLAFAYMSETLFATIFFTIFRICMGFTLPIVVIWFVWIFVKIAQDKEMKNLLNRGMFKQNF